MKRDIKKKVVVLSVFGMLSSFALSVAVSAPASFSASAAGETTVLLAENKISINAQEATNVTFEVDGETKTIAYDMQDGASVRLLAPTGIRFSSFISQADYEGLQTEYGEENVEIGTIIVEADNYDADTFKVGGEKVARLKGEKISLFDEGNGILRFCAAINTLPENAYDTSFYAKSYVAVTVDGDTYYGYTDFTDDNKRDIDQVATRALLDAEKAWANDDRYLLEEFAADKQEGKVTVDSSNVSWMTAIDANATKIYEMDKTTETSIEVTKAGLEAFDETAKGNEAERTKTYTVYTDSDVYQTEALVVSVVIDTKEELLNWQDYTVKGEVQTEEIKNMTVSYIDSKWASKTQKFDRTYKYWAYDGYVVLGANIDLTFARGTNSSGTVTDGLIKMDENGEKAVGSDIIATEDFCVKYNNTALNCPEYGFMGTFDGRGYTISGGVYGAGGLFGGVGGTGVVKNLAIKDAALFLTTYADSGLGSDGTLNTDANVDWGDNAIIGRTFCGTMENCLIEVKYNPRMLDADFADKKIEISGVTTANGETTTTTLTVNHSKSVMSTVFFSINGTLKDVVIYNPKYDDGKHNKCTLCVAAVDENIAEFENVYVYTNYEQPAADASLKADLTSSSANPTITGVTRALRSVKITQDIIDSLDSSLWDITLGARVDQNGFNLKPMV